jgi:hypothetical protein
MCVCLAAALSADWLAEHDGGLQALLRFFLQGTVSQGIAAGLHAACSHCSGFGVPFTPSCVPTLCWCCQLGHCVFLLGHTYSYPRQLAQTTRPVVSQHPCIRACSEVRC